MDTDVALTDYDYYPDTTTAAAGGGDSGSGKVGETTRTVAEQRTDGERGRRGEI